MDSYSLERMTKGAKKLKKENKKKELEKTFKSNELLTTLSKEDYLPIQILLLSYLGISQNLPGTNQNKAKLLGIVLKTSGSENIRKFLSDLLPAKSETNLKIVFEVFDTLGFKSEAEAAQRDLKRIMK